MKQTSQLSFNRNNLLLSLFFLLCMTACGIQEAKYVEYESDTNSGSGDTKSCEGAQTAFANVATLIQNGNCAASGCHGTGNSTGLTLGADQDENRQALKATSLGADAEKLYGKLTGVITHGGGGNFGNQITQDDFAGWLTAEAACP